MWCFDKSALNKVAYPSKHDFLFSGVSVVLAKLLDLVNSFFKSFDFFSHSHFDQISEQIVSIYLFLFSKIEFTVLKRFSPKCFQLQIFRAHGCS